MIMRKVGSTGNITSVTSNISSTSPYPNGNWTSNAVANTKDILKVTLKNEVTQQTLKVDGLKFNYEAPVVELGGWGRVDGESLGVTTATIISSGVGCTTSGTIYSNYSASGYAGPAQVGFTVDSKGSLSSVHLISNGRYPDNWGTPNYKPTTWTRNASARSYSVGIYTSNDNSNYTKNQTITINESSQEFILDISSSSKFKYILFKIESSDTIATTMSLKAIGEHTIYKCYIPTRRLPTKYYKYTYENWTQPVMTSNYQNGVKLTYANMSSANIYTLFNGVSNSDYITPTSTSSYASYVNIAFDYPIRLSNIKINSYTKRNVTYAFGACKIIATTKDGQEVTVSTTTLPDSQAWADTNFSVNNLIIKNLRIYATSGGNPHPRIGEITLTAQKQIVVESTSSDYDYKVTEVKEYLPVRKINGKVKIYL